MDSQAIFPFRDPSQQYWKQTLYLERINHLNLLITHLPVASIIWKPAYPYQDPRSSVADGTRLCLDQGPVSWPKKRPRNRLEEAIPA
jgi:hypothetical protein